MGLSVFPSKKTTPFSFSVGDDAASDATGEPVEVAVLEAAEDAARDATSE